MLAPAEEFQPLLAGMEGAVQLQVVQFFQLRAHLPARGHAQGDQVAAQDQRPDGLLADAVFLLLAAEPEGDLVQLAEGERLGLARAAVGEIEQQQQQVLAVHVLDGAGDGLEGDLVAVAVELEDAVVLLHQLQDDLFQRENPGGCRCAAGPGRPRPA